MKICTCEYSPVNSTTIDPPHIVWIDPFCHFHGLANLTVTDEEYERDAEDAQRRRDAKEGFDE